MNSGSTREWFRGVLHGVAFMWLLGGISGLIENVLYPGVYPEDLPPVTVGVLWMWLAIGLFVMLVSEVVYR